MKLSRKAKRYIKGKNMKKVSILPNFYFALKGSRDAKHAPSTAYSNIVKLVHCTDGLVSKEILKIEDILYPIRKEAAMLITSIVVTSKTLKEMPNEVNDSSAVAIRSNKKLKNSKRSYIAIITNNHSKLAEINELIVVLSSALEQRIERTKKMSLEKISCYECGLRSGGMSDYRYEVTFSTEAYEKYTAEHKSLMNKIKFLTEKHTEEEA